MYRETVHDMHTPIPFDALRGTVMPRAKIPIALPSTVDDEYFNEIKTNYNTTRPPACSWTAREVLSHSLAGAALLSLGDSNDPKGTYLPLSSSCLH